MNIAQTLAAFASELHLGAVPHAVRERARYLMLDAIGIGFASTRYEFAQRSLAAAQELSSGNSPVIGLNARLAPREAILLNGVLVHGLDYDDTHGRGVIHATASCLPTALVLAAHYGLSGSELLAAYIAGMEAATRVAAVAQGGFHLRGFHPTGLVGAFAAALIAGRLQGQAPAQMAMAQGIALSMAGGSLEFLEDGAWTKRLHPGWAGAAGYTAATLARHGITGPAAAYEGRYGLYRLCLGSAADELNLAEAVAGLNDQWEILQVAVKPLPACHFTHACADAAILLHNQGIEVQRIRHIEAWVPAQTVGVVCEPVASKRRPKNSYEAQFSIHYAVASGLLRGRFGLAEQDGAALTAPEVLALADKVEHRVDPASGFPRHYSGEVRVTLDDGQVLSHREAINRGNAERPLSNAEITAKAHANITTAFAAQRAEQVIGAVLNLEQHSAAQLAATLAAPA
ncbi:MmgE/PrpD family protein [Pseudomonas sp. NPDC007930]|uniref:MmgE/PrpD family protein n=1 Tax=Pseudomonas sp. NPDC007930 TaxID=3364417 RepID=UPI0036E94499